MRHLRQLGNQFSIPIERDADGYLGRECPECERYFKITPGTGITEGEPPCYCPYCGQCAPQDQFFTKDQIEYAKSVVLNKVTNAVLKDMKSLEFNITPRGPFGIGISAKVQGRPHRIRHYSEMRLEEEVVCDHCTLRYTVYGTFAYCPDCGRHNSRQILDKNLNLAEQQLALSNQVEGDICQQLVADALENVVSAFDGFGRETCRVHASNASDPAKGADIRFQNLTGAQKNVQQCFGIDLTASLSTHEWEFVCRCFQKRHLLAHKMGIIDDAYIKATGDQGATVGRKVSISVDEVTALLNHVRTLGKYLTTELDALL